MLRIHIVPTFGKLRLDQITSSLVERWHAKVARKNSHNLPRTIMRRQ
jgi:hypothetical protein